MNPKKIPVILGLFLTLSGIVAAVYLTEIGFNFFPKAEPKFTPQSVRITNIDADKFTVSWETKEASTGFIKYGFSSSLKSIAFDDRDQKNGQTKEYFLHYVTLFPLEPTTNYYFKIGSGKNLYDNQDALFQVKTAPLLGNFPLADAAYGRIIKEDGTPAFEVIVYLNLPESQSLSCLTDRSGNWMIPKNLARSQNLLSWANYERQGVEEILVQAGPEGVAAAIIPQNADQPVPEITLGRNYNFQKEKESSAAKQVKSTPPLNILASKDYVLPAFSASPSGEISPTTTPTPTPIPSVTPIPQEVPQPGHWLPSVLIIIAGLLFIFGGVVFTNLI